MLDKKQLFDSLLIKIKAIVKTPATADEKLLKTCQTLKDTVPYYNWVGFYLIAPDKPKELILGPYVGEPTTHTCIPFGKGICGQAAERKEAFVIPDVSQQSNYLSCSPKVKSEIVLPIIKNGALLGELDIDSHTVSPFTAEDNEFLTQICSLVAESGGS